MMPEELDERGKLCRVQWDKARAYYDAFFTQFNAVMRTLSSDQFDDWLHRSVGISFDAAFKASELLNAVDAKRVQSEMKEKLKTAREAKKQERLELKAQQIATQLAIEKDRTELRKQQAINSELTYQPLSREVKTLLADLEVIHVRTVIENGMIYLRLKEAVKSGAEGNDPATGKKWKWEKWAAMAIRRPMPTIRRCMGEAKAALEKNDHYRAVFANPLNPHDSANDLAEAAD